MRTVTTIADLRAAIRTWRQAGETVGLVPTMGALHEGHLALVRHARAKTMRACATLFVNPTQFGPNEDLAAYPRTETDDIAKLTAEKVDLLFKPAVAEMYRPGHATRVRVEGLGDILEGEFRPGFFVGVATVVTKLLLQALPDVAVFGDKDYQQLLVVRRLVADLDIPVRIEAVATARDRDGLALSSRNAYLSAAERKIAPALHGTIAQVAETVGRGADPAKQADWGKTQLERAGFARVDYLTVRDAATLAPVVDAAKPARVLAAAWLGKTRLIDNVPV
jgi:pantoate--beta-alanine ligase